MSAISWLLPKDNCSYSPNIFCQQIPIRGTINNNDSIMSYRFSTSSSSTRPYFNSRTRLLWAALVTSDATCQKLCETRNKETKQGMWIITLDIHVEITMFLTTTELWCPRPHLSSYKHLVWRWRTKSKLWPDRPPLDSFYLHWAYL